MTLLSDQIRAALAELRAELDEQVAESLRVLLDLAGDSEGDAADLRSAFQQIDAATSESEVLCRLLEQCSTRAERVGLLLVKKDGFEGWAGIGFDQTTFGDLRVEVEDVAATALQAAHSVTASKELEQALASALGTPPPFDAVTIPFVLRGSTEALVYANRASSEASLVVDDLRILCGVAAQALTLLTLRAGDEADDDEPEESPPEHDSTLPATNELPAEEPETVDETPTGAAETRQDEGPIGDPHDGIAAVLDGGSLQNAEGVTMSDSEAAIGTELAATSEWKLPGTAEAPAETSLEPTIWETGKFTAPQATPPSEPDADDEAAAQESAVVDEIGDFEEEAIDPNAIVPPTDLTGPGSAFSTGANAIDDIMDEDEQARRLAGFLVSEIKLYNEERLRDALASGGVYAALEEDIELARGIYDDRTDADLRSSTSYFDDEVLRVLADGDPSILGV